MSSARLLLRTATLLAHERWTVALLGVAAASVASFALAEPVLFGDVVDALVRRRPIGRWIGLWATFGALSLAGSVASALFADRLAHRARAAVIERGFAHALEVPPSYHLHHGTSGVVRTVLAAADSVFAIVLSLFREQLPGLFGMLFLIPVAVAMDARLAGVLGGLGLAFAVANSWVIIRTSAAQQAVEGHYATIAGRMGDVLGNLAVVQAYDNAHAELAELRATLTALLRAQYPVLTWWSVVTVFTRAASTLAMIVVLFVGGAFVDRGELGVGELVSFIGFANVLIARLDALSWFVVRAFGGAPVLASLFELLDHPQLVDAPDAEPLPAPVRGELRFERVSYTHPGGAGVHELDFVVRAGETVAIVGPSGSGKTTTLALLQRLMDPHAGRISLDGHDLRTVTRQSLRRAIAVIPQDPGLFRRSIAANLRIGRADATESELRAAATLVDADQLVDRQPEAWNAPLGEHGARLSGGERQRLAIARAVIKDAPILVLDEATSALDSDSEARIRSRLRSGRTTIVVTHRLATIADVDTILVLHGGQIVERGTFSALTGSETRFAALLRQGLLERETARTEAS